MNQAQIITNIKQSNCKLGELQIYTIPGAGFYGFFPIIQDQRINGGIWGVTG